MTVSVTRHHFPRRPGDRPRPTRRRLHPSGRRSIRLLGRALSVLVILLWSLFPLYWALNTSLTTLSGAESRPRTWSPLRSASPATSSCFGVTGPQSGFASQFGRSLLNAVIESGGAMVLTIVIAVLGAYAFARMEFRFKRTIFPACWAPCCCPPTPPSYPCTGS